ncbi:MAG: PAS domain S-box protein [Halobaculum sp.]
MITGAHEPVEPSGLYAALAGGESVESVTELTVRRLGGETENASVTLWTADADGGLRVAATHVTTDESERPPPPRTSPGRSWGAESGVVAVADPQPPFRSRVLVPVGDRRVLDLAATEPDVFGEPEKRVVGEVGRVLAAALDRIESREAGDSDGPEPVAGPDDGRASGGAVSDATDAATVRRLHELTAATDDFDDTVEQLLSLGCEYFGLDTGILAHVEGTDYRVEAVVDETDEHEPDAVYDLEATMCETTLASDTTEPVAFADVTETDHRNHPAATDVRAYIAAPVLVDGEQYGTVNFSMDRRRTAPFRTSEREFVTLLAQWIGSEMERRRRVSELERYETILDAVGDPVYALDADGRFTFVNEAAKREFGYGPEVLGEHVSVGMDDDDVRRVRDQIEELLAGDGRSTRATFELTTADGERRTVENRLAVIGDDTFRGTAGVLRDITERTRRQRRLESFQQAVESARDGIAVLDDGEYTYIDQSHVDMYGFEATEQLLGNSWRKLYDDDEIDRLEREVFPVLESEGYWRGMVTGCRPDGSTFPAELSLTTTEDGRLVCTVRDESDRQRREREQRRTQRRYQALVENIPNGGVLLFDEELEYTVAAGELLDQWELTESDFVGSAVGTVLAAGDHPLVPRFRAALNGERTDRRVEFDDRTVRIHIVPMGEDDADGGLLLAQDVTAEARRERELSAEREQFRLLTESVEEYAFVVADTDGVVQTWTEGAEELFGYDTETAVGMSISRLYSDDEEVVSDRLLQQARITGESSHDGWCVRADGSEFYAEVRHAPLETDDGASRGCAVIVRDMTDRRRQRRRTERFVEESQDVICVVETDGTITYVSGSASRVLDHDPDDLVGQNLFDHLHPDGREAAMETFAASIENPDATAEAECRIKSGTGEWRNVEGKCRNMLDDDAVDGMLLYLRDVTEAKRRARRFESIFNQTFQFTGLLDPDGTVVEVNDAALQFGGLERAAIVGEQFAEVSWWTHSETVTERLRNALDRAADGEFVRYETEVRGADGLATIDFSVKPVTDEDGTVTTLVVEGRDVTDRERHRRQFEVMHRVMRHNMRNDLTKVRGWAGLLCDEPDPERRADQFETIERVLDRWERMIEKVRRMRALSRPERRDYVSVESLVGEAVSGVDVPVETTATGDASARVPAEVEMAVEELVENAAGASERITVELADAGAEWVELHVRDDGPGMPEMEATVLETGEETQLTHSGGLGLWIVRTVVSNVGGDVSVASGPEGTDVCLELPTEEAVPTGQA